MANQNDVETLPLKMKIEGEWRVIGVAKLLPDDNVLLEVSDEYARDKFRFTKVESLSMFSKERDEDGRLIS